MAGYCCGARDISIISTITTPEYYLIMWPSYLNGNLISPLRSDTLAPSAIPTTNAKLVARPRPVQVTYSMKYGWHGKDSAQHPTRQKSHKLSYVVTKYHSNRNQTYLLGEQSYNVEPRTNPINRVLGASPSRNGTTSSIASPPFLKPKNVLRGWRFADYGMSAVRTFQQQNNSVRNEQDN